LWAAGDFLQSWEKGGRISLSRQGLITKKKTEDGNQLNRVIQKGKKGRERYNKEFKGNRRRG